MSNEADRMSRAGNYVLGLMNEAERERAERDLERDASFRDAVLSVAERMRIIGAPPEKKSGPDERWRTVSARIADLPQMRGIMPAAEPTPSGKAEVSTRAAAPLARVPFSWRGPHAVPSMRAAVMAACLIAAFAAGYIAGVSSPALFGTDTTDAAGVSGKP